MMRPVRGVLLFGGCANRRLSTAGEKGKPARAGEILLELYLEPPNLSITDAAEKLLIARPNLFGIVNGKNGISPLMAVKLAKAFDTTPQYWMNLQASHDPWQVIDKGKTIDKIKALV